MKYKIFIFAVIVLAFISGYFAGCNREREKVTIKTTDTLYINHTIHDTIVKPKFYTKKITETVIDSSWIESYKDSLYKILNSKEPVEFIAEKDTTYIDDKLTAKVQFVSPIPLHPKSHFNLDIKYKETQIKETAIIEPSFWSKLFNRFGIYTGVGLGYTPDSKLVPNVNISFGFKIFP